MVVYSSGDYAPLLFKLRVHRSIATVGLGIDTSNNWKLIHCSASPHSPSFRVFESLVNERDQLAGDT